MMDNKNNRSHRFISSSQYSRNTVSESKTASSVNERCYLCYVFRSSFYCETCISQGNFVSTSDPDQITFIQRKEELKKAIEDKEDAANMCRDVLNRRVQQDTLPQQIEDCSERIKALKRLIHEKREAIDNTKTNLKIVREKNKTRETRLPRYRERVDKLASYVNHNMKSEVNTRKAKLASTKQDLMKIAQKRIEELIKYIFPVEKINPTSRSMNEEESEMVSALAEASKTSFVRGTWVLMDSSGELHHRIVSPTLPGSGDYSAYLAVEHENSVPISEHIAQNEAYNIGAALCYTTQLVNLLAFYLDVILPKKVSYADFCARDLTEREFHRKVAWLNRNVLYLCFSQGMDTVLLNPKHTLNNLLNLVQHAELGQTGAFHVDSGVILSLECEDDVKDDGSDDENNAPWEWEAIPLVACPETAPGSLMSTTQQSASIAGGLVTSLASMFRGWTK